jgi:outer membrane protein TolC
MKRISAVLLTALLLGQAAQAEPAAGPVRLTLREAIELGLKANLGVLVARAAVDEAAGTRERRSSVLLPHVSADHVTSFQNRNLQAFGISIRGFPLPVAVGPFSNYDYRIFASQSVVDRQASHALKASADQEQAARLSYQDARDLVVRQAAGLYLDAQSAAAQVEAAESRLRTSRTLLQLAQDQHGSGLATGVDVVRAQVQAQRDRQSLLVAQDSYATSLLALERFLAIRPGTPLELAEPLAFHQVEAPNPEEAMGRAVLERSDYRSLLAQRDSLVEQMKASRARYLPKFSVDGNYGALGRSYGTMPGIGAIEGTLQVTVFDRDRNGEQQEIASRIDRIDRQIADLKLGIEQDLRQAILDLDSAAQQVTVTQAALELAQRELALAQDRFKNGLGDNVEVITAQSALQSSQDDRILALARHADATMALVRALGAGEKNYQRYLGGGPQPPSSTSSGTEVPR